MLLRALFDCGQAICAEQLVKVLVEYRSRTTCLVVPHRRKCKIRMIMYVYLWCESRKARLACRICVIQLKAS